MSSPRALPHLLLTVALLAACQSDGGHLTLDAGRQNLPPSAVTLFTQNVYVGTDVDAVLAAPADQLPNAIGQALAVFMATDWPARADAIAAKIVATHADIVALNEITRLTVTGLGPLLPEVAVDFLPILMDRIAARGGAYQLAGVVANTDANLSVGPGGVRLEDFDAVLVRSALPHILVAAQQFAARAPVDFGPLGSFALVRGFVAVDLTVGGTTVRVIATHLEPRATAPVLQAAQAAELLAWIGASDRPTIVTGDLNSAPTDASAEAPYQQFMAAGFRDTWLERTGPKSDPGYTCCHTGDLSNPDPTMSKRIDHVLVRDPHPGHGATVATLYGATAGDRLANGLWPSDHAGLITQLMFPGNR